MTRNELLKSFKNNIKGIASGTATASIAGTIGLVSVLQNHNVAALGVIPMFVSGLAVASICSRKAITEVSNFADSNEGFQPLRPKTDVFAAPGARNG